MEYEAVIGLEVHAQLRTRSKLFCSCATQFGASPNANTCPVCLGLPGALPVLNSEAVAMAVRAALALGCTVRPVSIFARKNYFYPDLPKGYQISQFDRPLGEHGKVCVLSGERNEDGRIVRRTEKVFGITRLHLEEDAGKSLHGGPAESDETSYVDLNRSGVPLIEVVSEPDFHSSQEAYDYLTHLRKVLLYLGVCDGNMEEGSLRCDANVSVRPRGTCPFGTKVEVKNVNSFRFLQKALDYEIGRQIAVLSESGRVLQETRSWDEAQGCTLPMRSKEEAHDYRYFPEPDLPPLELSTERIELVRASLPELPDRRLDRFMSVYQLPADDALQLTSTPALADYYEECAHLSGNPHSSAAWIMGDLTHALKSSDGDICACPVPAARLAGLIRLIDGGGISGKMAKTVFEEMYATGELPERVVARLGLSQINDEDALAAVIQRVMSANPRQLAEYRSGREKLFGFFAGQVMKETRGQANPQLLNALLQRLLPG